MIIVGFGLWIKDYQFWYLILKDQFRGKIKNNIFFCLSMNKDKTFELV